MKIETFGDKSKPAFVAIHPMFTGGFFIDKLIEICGDDYYFIVPTMSGHYENSEYVSREDEENTIAEFLKSNGIEKVAVLLGFSLGGNMAFDMYAQNLVNADKVIIDSAPLFNFPKIIRNYFHNRYKRCLKKIKTNGADVAKELNKCFNGMGEVQKDVAPTVSFESLKNLVVGCFGVEVPKMSEEKQSAIIFVYGSKDEAKLCLSRVRKYKKARIVSLKGYRHCGLYQSNATEYVEKFIK
ncbi:MAG: hypothetical protein K2N47_00770 [Clostridia bacterium]|nr:hypothetical protein [Clostridia bacterium]